MANEGDERMARTRNEASSRCRQLLRFGDCVRVRCYKFQLYVGYIFCVRQNIDLLSICGGTREEER